MTTTHITIYWDLETCPPIQSPNGHYISDCVVREAIKGICVKPTGRILKHIVSWRSPDIDHIHVSYGDHYREPLVIPDNSKYVFFNSYVCQSITDGKTELVVITGDENLLQIIRSLESLTLLDSWGQLSIIYGYYVDIRSFGFSSKVKTLKFNQILEFCNNYCEYSSEALISLMDDLTITGI